MRVLLLGGTTEARRIAEALAGDRRIDAVISLAGRTRDPLRQKLPTRIGGFGGTAGLVDYLRAERIAAVIDATHPFAVRIARNAQAACAEAGIPLCAVSRPEWCPVAGDRWIIVRTIRDAVAALGEAGRNVFLTIGQKDLASFKQAPHHRYVIRSVDHPASEALPPRAEIISARGPFLEADERRLLVEKRIEVLVTKNSGGAATEAKLHAARALCLPVVMLARPDKIGAPAVAETVADAEGALRWLAARHAAFSERGA